jgi:hypothetical protein
MTFLLFPFSLCPLSFPLSQVDGYMDGLDEYMYLLDRHD